MDEMNCNCAKCAIVEKICRVEDGKGPAWCPTKKETATLKEALGEYDAPGVKEFARTASVQEGACYAFRNVKPYVMVPTKTRVEELIEFSTRMGYKKLGMAFCGGLTHECVFRRKSATHSDSNRPPIPFQSGRGFRFKPATF